MRHQECKKRDSNIQRKQKILKSKTDTSKFLRLVLKTRFLQKKLNINSICLISEPTYCTDFKAKHFLLHLWDVELPLTPFSTSNSQPHLFPQPLKALCKKVSLSTYPYSHQFTIRLFFSKNQFAAKDTEDKTRNTDTLFIPFISPWGLLSNETSVTTLSTCSLDSLSPPNSFWT